MPGKKKVKQMGPEGQGSSGDVRDRFGDVYQPGAHPPDEFDPVKMVKRAMKKKPKPAKPKRTY